MIIRRNKNSRRLMIPSIPCVYFTTSYVSLYIKKHGKLCGYYLHNLTTAIFRNAPQGVEIVHRALRAGIPYFEG